MGPSKAQDKVSDEHKTMYFVRFPAHRLFLSWKRLNLGQDASRWPKMRPLGAVLGLRRGAAGGQKCSGEVRQVGTKATSVLYFTDQNSLRVNRKRNFVMRHGVTYIMPMCILYCILHIRMLLRCAAVAAVSGYGGVF